MLREQLTTAVKKAVVAEGYSFYSGFDYRITRETQLFPAAWMAPLQLTKLEGLEEGFATYKTTLHLLWMNKQYDANGKMEYRS